MFSASKTRHPVCVWGGGGGGQQASCLVARQEFPLVLASQLIL